MSGLGFFTFSKYIKSWDKHGHKVMLKFNDKGDTHKTLLGGCISILMHILLTGYLITLLLKMGSYGNDKNSTTILNSRDGIV